MRLRSRTFVLLDLAAASLSVGALAAQQPGVDVQRYRFEIALPEVGKKIRVASTVTFTRAVGVESLRLDLLAPMTVRSATLGCGSAPTSAPFTHDGQVIAIALGPSYRAAALEPTSAASRETPTPRDTLCVTVRYDGAPADGLIISTDSAGRWAAFGDNWPDRARHWLASVDHPSDKALVEFVVDAPAERRVVSNGTQRASTDIAMSGSTGGTANVAARGPRRRTTWATVAPIPTYLMVIAAAPLAETSLGQTACGSGSVSRCVPQQVFTAPEQVRFLPGNFTHADSIVAFFARTVGPFPYEQLSHLQSSTRFGGMENAGAIFYADRLFRRPNGLGVELIAHETAHQWFGDAVTERAWGHVWLSEGFATYFAALYTEHTFGDSAFRADLTRIRNAVLDAAVVAERPVIDTAQTDLLKLLNRNSYEKGGFVLHMLRREVGDTAFFRAIRAYHAAHLHGNALTDDLRLAVEHEAGRDLRWFFDQWLTRPGFAELTVRWSQDASTGQLALQVAQGARFAPYRFPLRLEVETADGERSLVSVDIPAERNARVIVPARPPSSVRSVRVDPLVELLADIKTP